MNPQFGSRQHQWPPKTQHEVGAVRHSESGFQIFQRVLPPHLLPLVLRRYDQLDVKLQPFVRDDLGGQVPYRLPDSLLFPARSTKYLPRCRRKPCAPNRAKWLPSLKNTQNCDAWRVQSLPTRNGPLRQDHAQSRPDALPNLAPGLTRSYPSAPLLLRSLPPSARGKRRSLRKCQSHMAA